LRLFVIFSKHHACNAAPIYELSRDRRLQDVRSLLLHGVDVNALCPHKGYTALIAAVYNSDLPMVKLLLKADELCRKTYFSTQFSILSAIKSVIHGTEELVEADAELRVNEDGVVEGEPEGYLRTVDNTEKEYLSTPNTPSPRKQRHPVTRVLGRTVGVAGASVNSNQSSDSINEIAHTAPTVRFAGKTNVTDLDASGRNGMRALHYASQIGDIRIVGALLQAGANREVFNNKLHTPLDVCIANNHIAAANAVRFDPEKVSICLAAKHGDWTVMQALLCQGVSINTQRNHQSKTTDQLQHELYTPLLAAVAYGQTEMVKHILDVPGVDVNLANSLNQTALMFAAARGDENVVLLLLSRGADRWVLDNQGYIATAWAESRKRDTIVTVLKHDPARIWIHDVIRNNDFAGVIAMLKQKVDVNLRRLTKHVPNSPATAAVAKIDAVGSHAQSEKIPERRRASGSAPSSATKRERASTTAAAPGSISQEESLNGSAGSGSFIHGETPLIVAARYSRLDVIAILLKAPAPNAVDVNLTDSAGNTPLHHAAAKGHEEAALLLLKAQASRHARNLLGLSPSLVAKSAGYQQIAAIIETDPYLVHIHDVCESGDVKTVSELMLSLGVGCRCDNAVFPSFTTSSDSHRNRSALPCNF
jgi:ankyrin repeat protein